MNKKGFTLVELLAVVVILSIIALITTFSVKLTLSDSKKSLSNVQKNNVENAAKTYYLKEGMTDNISCINISELINKGYIEGKSVIDPETKEEMPGSVKITYEANQYSYEYQTNVCKYCTLNDKDSSNGPSLSDEVTCGTEKFYVISTDKLNGTVQMLTEKNINTTTYRQSDDAGTVAFSTGKYGTDEGDADIPPYWLGENWNLLPQYTLISVAVPNPVNDYSFAYANVYDENNDIIKPIVDNYVSYLKGELINATGSLLTLDQILNLGCIWDGEYSDCTSAPPWISSTYYWLGSAHGGNDRVLDVQNGIIWHSDWIESRENGVRPVITISTSQLK